MKKSIRNANANANANAETLKNQKVLKSTSAYNTEKTAFTYAEKVSMIVAVMSDKQKLKSLIGSLKQSTAFNAFLCLSDVKKKEDYENLWDNLKESLKEKGFKLAGSPLHKCFASIWYMKSEQKEVFSELTEGKDLKDAFLALSRFLKEKELSFTVPVSKIKEALNGKTAEQAEQAEQAESPIETAIQLIQENVQSVTTEQAEKIIEILESRYLGNEKAA